MPRPEPISVPVHTDKRSLEQKHRDLVSSLHRLHRQSSADPRLRHSNEFSPDLQWSNEINQWIDTTNRLWTDVMRRMRQNQFALVPADAMDLDLLCTAETGDSLSHVPSILSRMDQQLRTLRQQMSQLSPTEPLSMLSYNTSSDEPFGPIVPEGGLKGDLLGFLKDAFQLGEDGKVKFHVQFDVRGYEPENIQVRTEKNWLNVHAKKTVKTATGRSSIEYCRTVYVPSSVDKDHFECLLTKDGVLILEAPVKHDSQLSIKFDRDLQLGIKPPSPVQKGQQQVHPDGEQCTDLQVTGQPGPTILEDGTNKRRLHVEFPVEAGFTGDDLSVRVDANRLIVTGHHEVKDDKGKFQESCVREFTRWYSIPETVDPFSIKVQLHGATVVVEAPLVQPAQKK